MSKRFLAIGGIVLVVPLLALAVVTNDKSPFLERWGGWYVTV